MQYQKRKKVNVAMRMAIVLFILTVVASSMSSGLYAKWIVSESSVNTARVAKFDITLEPMYNGAETSSKKFSFSISPGGSDTRTIQIINKSEVAVQSEIEVKNDTGNLPLKFILQKYGDNTTSTNTITTNHSPISENEKESGQITTYTLKIEWDDTVVGETSQYQGQVDNIIINVRFVQID